MSKHIDIFIAYAHEDESILAELKTHLTVLERTQNVTVWYDGLVAPGQEWQATTKEVMQKSQIILLLISADFIASDECYNESMTAALAMHKAGKCMVVPILARPCLWQDMPFAFLQILPKNQQPLMSSVWRTAEEPFTQVAENLRFIVQKIQGNIAPQTILSESDSSISGTATTRFSMRFWYFLGGGTIALLASFFAYHFFNSRAEIKELAVKTAQHQQDSTKAFTDFKFYLELGDNECLNSPSKDDYLRAMSIYEKAVDAVTGFKINTDSVKLKIEDCKKHLSSNVSVDTVYVAALLKYTQKINEAHKLYRIATALKGKKSPDEVADAFRKSKNMYNEAILAVGKNAIDVSAAQEGRYACEEEIIALSPAPIAIVEAPKPSNNNNKMERKSDIKVVIPKVKPAKVKDMSSWKKSMEKNVKLEEAVEKYNIKEDN
jgi:hypothetical protein